MNSSSSVMKGELHRHGGDLAAATSAYCAASTLCNRLAAVTASVLLLLRTLDHESTQGHRADLHKTERNTSRQRARTRKAIYI
eukprot:2439-Heterococcus_DN1.PRE.1